MVGGDILVDRDLLLPVPDAVGSKFRSPAAAAAAADAATALSSWLIRVFRALWFFFAGLAVSSFFFLSSFVWTRSGIVAEIAVFSLSHSTMRLCVSTWYWPQFSRIHNC